MKGKTPTQMYREVARAIVGKLKENLIETLEQGRMADPYWKLESAIIEAMRLADSTATNRTMAHLATIITDFEDNDGTKSQ